MSTIIQTERRKLGGAVKLALTQKVAELTENLAILNNTRSAMEASINDARVELTWIEHGVRVGSIIKNLRRHTTRIKPTEDRIGQVVKVFPCDVGKPGLEVVWALKNGGWGSAPHRLFSFIDNWEIVTE